jgi:hypothetical protein
VTARAIAAAALLATLAGAEARAQSASPDGGAAVPSNEGTAPAATPPPAATTAPDSRVNRRPEAVDITVVGSGDAFAGLRARVGDRLPLGVPLLWNRIDRFNPLTELLRGAPPPHPTGTLRCWIDLADLRHATLYFADQRGERFLVRELPLSGRFDEVDQQSVAQVMELSVSALIENAEIGFSRAQAREILARAQPPEPVVATAPPADGARWRLAAGIFYALEDLGAGLSLAQGPGLLLALGRLEDAPAVAPAEPGAGGWLTTQYRIPIEARKTNVGARLTALAARVGVEARWWRLHARLGAGADFTHVTPLPGAASTGTALATPHWSTSFVATGALAMRLPLERAFGPLLAFSLALFLDMAPSTTAYGFSDATGNHVAFAPRRLRPGLALEVAY